MKTIISLCLSLFLINSTCFAQRSDIMLQNEKVAFAKESIQILNKGVLVVCLKAYKQKINALNATIKSSKSTAKQKKRYQKILDGTIKRRDEFNDAILSAFLDTFNFCPVYIIYDYSTKDLIKGKRKGIFLNRNKELDNSIQIDSSKAIFTVFFRAKSANFPYDVLKMRKLKENLEEPFPYFMPLRASWVNQINTPRIKVAVIKWDSKLKKLYEWAVSLK